MAMTPDHKTILRVNHTSILDNMSEIGGVLDVLYRDGIITPNSQELIMSKKTTKDKARELLTLLPRSGDVAFYGFIVALIETKQDFIAEMLDPNLGVAEMDATDVVDSSTIEDFTSEDFTVDVMTEAKKLQVSSDKDNYSIRPTECYGRAIIINNEKFEHMSNREGTHSDAQLLQSVFERLHFLPIIHHNKKAKEMEEILRDEGKLPDHDGYQAFFLCILSHGAKDHVFGIDGFNDFNALAIQEILNIFDGEQCLGLRGKPKFIFIQACQNGQVEQFCRSVTTWKIAKPLIVSSGSVHKNSDILLMLSTVAGDVSWRNKDKGSYFMRALCHVLAKYSHKEHIDNMMTRVVRLVCSMRILSNKGTTLQQPEKRSTLRKNFYFMP